MTVLFDISHPAHVHFFQPVANLLIDQGLSVHLVGRDKDVTAALLAESGLPHEVLPGPAPSASRMRHAAELGARVIALRRRIRGLKVDVVLTRNPSGVLAALGTRAQSIFDTDDGRSVGWHYWLARPFADVITSSTFDPENHGRHHRRYRGLKAHMFLHSRRFQTDPSVRARWLPPDEPLFVVRFSSHNASHDRGVRGIAPEQRRRIVEILEGAGATLVSSEGEGLRLARIVEGARVTVDVPATDFHHLLASASLCVGDSQSVAIESAVLGVPTLRLSSFTGKVYPLVTLEERGLIRNFSPGEDDQLVAAVESNLAILPERLASASAAARALADEADDLARWFAGVVHDLRG